MEPVRWGILGTANIATLHFLPALHAVGGGVAYAVAGRDPVRTQRFAADNGIERVHAEYADLSDDERVDAVYVPLPNSLHAEETVAALRSGKGVLCEKPLCVSAEETETVLKVARAGTQPLWEAFVFLFRDQTKRLLDLVSQGAIGELQEIHSTFHYPLPDRANIRLDPGLGGGVLYDAGCYPIRLARLVFGSEAVAGTTMPRWAREGVDEEMQAILTFPQERRLLFSCAMFRRYDAFARVIGSDGEIRLSRPFHPRVTDTLEIRREGLVDTEWPNGDEPSFAPALRHIHAALRGEVAPRHLAVDEALGNAQAIDLLYRSARSGQVERDSMPADVHRRSEATNGGANRSRWCR
jgi:predicted dehydrogenase